MSSGPLRSRANASSKGRKASSPARVSTAAPRRRAPAQQRSKLTVDAIVEAAGQLLVESGRASVTTNAVAERAGVSIGSLYQYFPNIDAVFAALQARHRDEVWPLVHHAMSRLADPSVDLVHGIVNLMKAMVELHKADPERMRALVDQLDEGTSRSELDELAAATLVVLQQRTGRQTEELRGIAWLAATSLTHIGRGLVHNPPRVDLDSVFDSLARMLEGLFSGLERR